jgi:beta-barrel assembly-enhancing protease
MLEGVDSTVARMDELKSAVVLALVAVIGLAACASTGRRQPAADAVEPVSSSKASELAAEQQRLRDIIVFASNHYGRGLAELRDAIAAPAFKSLAVDDQFQALTLATAATTPTETTLAHSYLDRAIALPGIGFEDQLATLGLAVNSGYAAAAAKSLTLLARQWPDRLASFDNRLIFRALWLAERVAPGDRLLVLQALYAAHWKVEWDIEPSAYWRDLALLLLEQGSLREAIDVSTHVTEPYVLIGMRADRRFDGIVAAHPEQFEVELAADRELKFFQSLSDEHPKSLALKARVMEALLHEQHYAAMLAASDYAVQEISATNFPDKLYDDYVEEHGSYFYLRSVALQREGLWDEAVAQLVEAGHEGDISQLINLASLYCALDRPKEALTVMSPVGPTRTSAYGTMQVEAVRLQSAVELGDRAQLSRSMQYLSSHYADAPRAYLYALMVAKQLDRAAHYLITTLEDKELRQSILPDIQEYLPNPGSKTELEMEARWRSVIARKEVQAAIHKVGRVESYHLEAP